jgi:hypothetical protein
MSAAQVAAVYGVAVDVIERILALPRAGRLAQRPGRPTRWPDLIETAQIRYTRVILAAAHLDHDPRNNRLRNLKSLCQRCHIMHDRPYHLAQRRITYLLRRALGDLFLGPYSAYSAVQTFQAPVCSVT